MPVYLSAGLILLAVSHAAFAKGNYEFQLTCQGRATMTVSRDDYGISTLMWPKQQFEIAAGEKLSRLTNGDEVSVTRFRDGDQMMVDDRTEETFFSYAGSDKIIPCARSANLDMHGIMLPPWQPSASGRGS